jgi:hypothetical protein
MSPRVRLWIKVGLFAAVLGPLVVLKHDQNGREVAHEAGRPARARTHFLAVAEIERFYDRKLFGVVGEGSDGLGFERVRAKLDPSGAANHYAAWTVGQSEGHVIPASFREPGRPETVQMRFFAGRLRTVWVDAPPFVDPPLPLWDEGEAVRKTAGVVAALVWLVAIIGAYREPLLRRRLAPLALATALIAMAAWSVEPPAAIRGPGLRVPGGPWIGAALVLLALPVVYRKWRPKVVDAGRCRRCNYDLTGNQSGVCPECGEPTPAEAVRRRKARAAQFAAALESEEPTNLLTAGDPGALPT